MTKVYPHVHHQQEPTTCCCCINHTNTRQTYTLWMKSLLFHSNGCTVYDSNGDVAYRVDNYDTKGTTQAYLMDLRGRVLCTIHKRKLSFGRWDVYYYRKSEEKPWFEVKACYKMKTGKVAICQMALGCQKFCIERSIGGKTAFRIVNNMNGNTVAHAKQKQSCSGVSLGKDVLMLDVEADIDHSLIMAFVTVFGLICGIM